jgi:hypothetical protein
MQRYLTLVVLFLFALPVGFSVAGCANHNSEYCNGAGYGYTKQQPVSITLQPQATGISLAFGQIGELTQPTATDCSGQGANVSKYTYGTTNRYIADVSPSGQVCAGTWNLNTPGVADYTTCVPTNQQGIAYLTASASGFTSNQVAVYAHGSITSLSITGPTDTSGNPVCLSQGQTSQLDATAYTTNSSGQQVVLCSPQTNDCSNVIGHVNYSADSAIVSINQTTNVATAQAPGAALITGSISSTAAASGYFYTCPPAKIELSVPITGATTASLTPNNPQPLTATVIDTNGNTINGLDLSYVSTNPSSIAVASGGAVTATYPSSAAITAICAPSTCNPAPINVIGSLGTGATVISNSVQVSSPGQTSNYLWVASPDSPYFVPTDLSTGTTGNPIKLPYTPNSMVLDPAGANLYFGSYNELMVYSAAINAITQQLPNLPGVVLGVSPDSNTVVINDQYRGVIYLYSVNGIVGQNITSIAGIGQKAVFTPDSQTLYILGTNTIYIHNTYTGWSIENLPPQEAGPTTGTCPANNASSPQAPPNGNPPNSSTNPNNTYNMFCAPDLAVTIPSAAVFLSGSPTSAYGICPNTATNPIVYYPQAATVGVAADHLAATTDGKHIIGATANPATLTDVSITVPINACPTTQTATGAQTIGLSFNPAPTYNQASLSSYGISNINQVVASTNSQDAFITYLSNATTAPAGGARLPVYEPSTQAGTLGTLTSVTLAGGAIAPIAGIFSPDNTLFFASTTGDDLIHIINTKTLTDSQQINPKLLDSNGNPVAAQFLAVKPRPTT